MWIAERPEITPFTRVFPAAGPRAGDIRRDEDGHGAVQAYTPDRPPAKRLHVSFDPGAIAAFYKSVKV